MSDPVYVISLVRCPARRQWISGQFARAGIAFHFLDAVDGRDLPHEAGAVPGAQPLNPGERACALSHLAAWRRLLQSGAAGAFVFEDDAEMRPGFRREILDEVAALARPGEVVLLHSVCNDTWLHGRRRLSTGGGTIAHILGETLLATAYYLTCKGAAAMVARWEQEDVLFPVDHWCGKQAGCASWARTISVLTVKPDLFGQNIAFPSEITALGRKGLSGAEFSLQRKPFRFQWRYARRDGMRLIRRMMQRVMPRPDWMKPAGSD